MTVGRFVTAANEVTIGGFWREHAKGELRTRKSHEILRLLNPCWGKEYMDKEFYAGNAIFGAFVQELLSMPINLLLAYYFVYPGTCSTWAQHICLAEALRRSKLTHGELTTFHRLMKYGKSLSARKAHPIPGTYSYKCAAGLKTLLLEYLLMQNRYLTGEERTAKTREEVWEASKGIPLLTDLCLAMRSDPVGMIRGLEAVVTCIYGPAVTYAFPDPLV